jgi:hypothetical protein
MQRIVFARIACGVAIALSMAACVVQPPAQRVVVEPQSPPPPPPQDPHMAAIHRFEQIQSRVGELSHRIDDHVAQGFYPPPVGGDLHHRVDVIWQEARDMASQHGGGLSGEEHRTLNQELDGAAHAIR